MSADGLTVRVDALERGLATEIEKRERSDKYRHNLAEDNQARFAEIKASLVVLQADYYTHFKDDMLKLSTLDERMRIIERLSWIAVGGVGIIGGGVWFFSAKIIAILTGP